MLSSKRQQDLKKKAQPVTMEYIKQYIVQPQYYSSQIRRIYTIENLITGLYYYREFHWPNTHSPCRQI